MVDVQGYGAEKRTTPDLLAMKAGLHRALKVAFRESGVRWRKLRCEGTGDGFFLLAPASVPKSVFVERVPHVLAERIQRYNAGQREQARMRIRAALHAGEVVHDARGATSPAITKAFRLLDAAELKAALAGSEGELALITSDWFYAEVVRHSTEAETYRSCRVQVKETSEAAWFALPRASYPPRPARTPVWLWGSVAGAASALVVAGAVFSPARPAAAPGESIMGAPRTADPCAVTFPDALGGYGVVEQSDDFGNFNRCDALVYPSGDRADYVDVSVELATGTREPMPVQWDGGFGVQRPPAEPGHCTRILLLPDAGTQVVVGADGDPAAKHDFCGMAEAVAARARTALGRGQIPRRQLPAGSLASKDACALLDTAATTEALGAGPVERIPGFANWACDWSYPDRPGLVKVLFDRTAAEIRQPGTPVQLGRYSARVQARERGDTSCTVTIVYRTYVDAKHQQTNELVVDVDKSDARPEDLCAPARSLAAAVATRL
ncbi:DUF3558 domain-containing protein [Amycolatopsis sp. WQ 127309]|uniref:DUF3558 domain-containing protein n=1 Tax=Amycolatopsis sp. WQ 127309 TaxID=2932773 RepID=UPI001FF5E7C1|nr:DUF3558 domain-containing protein [Amycolatopsis sp. WQ 127309]UOZ07541.1 DUF3558 domain-containing protein [Amycolatopsis sp. WQ 127309]